MSGDKRQRLKGMSAATARVWQLTRTVMLFTQRRTFDYEAAKPNDKAKLKEFICLKLLLTRFLA